MEREYDIILELKTGKRKKLERYLGVDGRDARKRLKKDLKNDKGCVHGRDYKIVSTVLSGKDTSRNVNSAKTVKVSKKVSAPASHKKKEDKPEIVMSEEDYLGVNGASRHDIGDAALHKNKGRNSDKQWSKIVDRQAKKDWELISKRARLREEYQGKIESGEIREPTAAERSMVTARGHGDNEAVKAARRICQRKGLDWVANKKASDVGTDEVFDVTFDVVSRLTFGRDNQVDLPTVPYKNMAKAMGLTYETISSENIIRMTRHSIQLDIKKNPKLLDMKKQRSNIIKKYEE